MKYLTIILLFICISSYSQEELILNIEHSDSAALVKALQYDTIVPAITPLLLKDWYKVNFNDSVNIEKVIYHYLKLDFIKHIELNKKGAINIDPISNDTYVGTQYYLQDSTIAVPNVGNNTLGNDIRIQQAWEIESGSPDIDIAYIDSGMDVDHTDLVDNFSGTQYNFTDDTETVDVQVHATGTVGIICATTGNSSHLAGVAGGESGNGGVKFSIAQAFDDYDGTVEDVANALVWFANKDHAILNGSFSFSGVSGILEGAMNYYMSKPCSQLVRGRLAIFSTGNSGFSYPYLYPAALSTDVNGIMSVTGLDYSDIVWPSSSYNQFVDVSAYAFYINNLTILPDPDGTHYSNGTSYSAPMVSGIAALIISKYPKYFTALEVKNFIKDSAVDMDVLNPTYAGKIGTGRVNAYAALLKADSLVKKRYTIIY